MRLGVGRGHLYASRIFFGCSTALALLTRIYFLHFLSKLANIYIRIKCVSLYIVMHETVYVLGVGLVGYIRLYSMEYI